MEVVHSGKLVPPLTLALVCQSKRLVADWSTSSTDTVRSVILLHCEKQQQSKWLTRLRVISCVRKTGRHVTHQPTNFGWIFCVSGLTDSTTTNPPRERRPKKKSWLLGVTAVFYFQAATRALSLSLSTTTYLVASSRIRGGTIYGTKTVHGFEHHSK